MKSLSNVLIVSGVFSLVVAMVCGFWMEMRAKPDSDFWKWRFKDLIPPDYKREAKEGGKPTWPMSVIPVALGLAILLVFGGILISP